MYLKHTTKKSAKRNTSVCLDPYLLFTNVSLSPSAWKKYVASRLTPTGQVIMGSEGRASGPGEVARAGGGGIITRINIKLCSITNNLLLNSEK